MRVLVLLFTLALFFNPGYVHSAPGGWTKVAVDIEKTLEEAAGDYKDGKVIQAIEKVADAYFGIFEGENANMEIAVRRYLSLKKATDLEKGFGDLRKRMSEKQPVSDIRKDMRNLTVAIREAAAELERKGVGLDVGYR